MWLSLVEALALGARCRRFKSCHPDFLYNLLSQMYVSKYKTADPVIQGTHKIAEQPLVYYREVIPSKIVDVMVEELREMEEFKLNFMMQKLVVNCTVRKDHSIRNSKLNWWNEEHWSTSIISHYIGLANEKYWEYDLNLLESVQISVYNKDGHYDWHSDYGTSVDGKFTRKLSASVLVSDPTEYIGGDLEFIDYHGERSKHTKRKGNYYCF